MLGIIGGTGFETLTGLQLTSRQQVVTSYGEPSAPLVEGTWFNKPCFFLQRHGHSRHIPPHRINYRANIAAMQQLKVTTIIAFNTVGGITAKVQDPPTLVVPDQIIDYSHGRVSSYFDSSADELLHIDFSNPYDEELRQQLIQSAEQQDIQIVPQGVYGCTQGPRLETAAEIQRLARDGCDIVGMTGMPEAALARELGLAFASLCLVVNPAAGCANEPLSIEAIRQVTEQGIPQMCAVMQGFIQQY